MKYYGLVGALALSMLLLGCVSHRNPTHNTALPVNPASSLVGPSEPLKLLPNTGKLYGALLAPTGSMVPTLLDYDLVLYTKDYEFEDIRIGDIVLFRDPSSRKENPTLVCHRVVYRNRLYLTTKGDNNLVKDPFPVGEDLIYAVAVGVIREDRNLPVALLAANELP